LKELFFLTAFSQDIEGTELTSSSCGRECRTLNFIQHEMLLPNLARGLNHG